MQWVKCLSCVSSFVAGLRTSDCCRKQHKSGEVRKTSSVKWSLSSFAPTMSMWSNWSSWQQSKILSCSLLVDVVVITLQSSSTDTHPDLPPPTRWNLLHWKTSSVAGLTVINSHHITKIQTMVLLSKKRYLLQSAYFCMQLNTLENETLMQSACHVIQVKL